jgi:hypothetical protein
MKAASYMLFAIAVFALYGTARLIYSQSFAMGPHKPVTAINASDNREAFNATVLLAASLSIGCFAGGIFCLIRSKPSEK